MADLAVTFHWTPADCAGFSLTELMQWRDRARRRTQGDDD
ncbi:MULTISPECIES: GpE family phage tail protein [unclassified Halomonas]|nr:MULTISPECIES: GpE family phage tail protein [unclassified Halomonas]MBR9880782.1 GpE family phage tail protein [Gammaproteobacteria bacterium]MBY5930795.1 GpE family phage tail protein [Halomonas sp. DP8Y7-3]MCJ8287092.1 GpE family phage tail protein [Halomonas sp.]NQY71808.1 GpE family phage tail protein [Halomonas sp.]RQW71341.1 GpE family phage tail protein [Halomonas sp. YLB-10]